MIEEQRKRELLAKWAEGTLSPDDKLILEKEVDLQAYQKLLDQVDQLNFPPYDVTLAYQNFEKNIGNSPGKHIRYFWLKTGIAATLLFLVGFFILLTGQKKIQASYGEQRIVILPDQSNVELNASSSLSYQKILWFFNRTVNLAGEARFEVIPGKRFRIQTDYGQVQVLGTTFNVKASEEVFRVSCYEGEVMVKSADQKMLVSAGEQVQKSGTGLVKSDFDPGQTLWDQQRSSFNQATLAEVLKSLQNQYGIYLKPPPDDQILSRTYTGSFPHHNIQTALIQIFEPLEISYTFVNDTLTVKD